MELLPITTYAAGRHVSPEIDLADDAQGYRLDLSRGTDATPEVWPDLEHLLSVQVEVLTKGEWLPWGNFTAYGGRHVQRDGQVAPTSFLKANVMAEGTDRKLRAILVTDRAVSTGITIEVA